MKSCDCSGARGLSAGARDTARALVTTLVAEDQEVLGRVNMDQALERLGRYVAQFPFMIHWAFKANLFIFGNGLPPFAWGFRRFSRMPLEKRLAYVSSWADSRLVLKRNLFVLIRLVILAAVLEDTTLLDWIGYSDSLRRRQERPAHADAGVMACRKWVEK